jgi:iron complex transport system permease protein
MSQFPLRPAPLAAGLLIVSLLLVTVGLAVGSTGLESLTVMMQDPVARQIVLEIRAPRVLGAWAAGALLGLSGALAQGLFRNPLADPFLLGSASGASLGVALALLVTGASPFAAEWLVRLGFAGAAFAGAAGAVLLTLLLARGVGHTLRLLLAGVVVGVVLGALGQLVTMMRPDVLLSMQGFMLGSTAFVGWSSCALMLGVWLICLTISWTLASALDALALGEATARSLGLALPAIRLALIAAMALATGAAVAQTGLIAFVGLCAPHLVRSMMRGLHRHLVVLASLVGGVLLATADVVARWVIAPQELPVGVLTAVMGGGYLLFLMRRQARSELGS